MIFVLADRMHAIRRLHCGSRELILVSSNPVAHRLWEQKESCASLRTFCLQWVRRRILSERCDAAICGAEAADFTPEKCGIFCVTF